MLGRHYRVIFMYEISQSKSTFMLKVITLHFDSKRLSNITSWLDMIRWNGAYSLSLRINASADDERGFILQLYGIG